jgi:hypothetical protein
LPPQRSAVSGHPENEAAAAFHGNVIDPALGFSGLNTAGVVAAKV